MTNDTPDLSEKFCEQADTWGQVYNMSRQLAAVAARGLDSPLSAVAALEIAAGVIEQMFEPEKGQEEEWHAAVSKMRKAVGAARDMAAASMSVAALTKGGDA